MALDPLVTTPWPPPEWAIVTVAGSRWATDGASLIDIDRCAPPTGLRPRTSLNGWHVAPSVESVLKVLTRPGPFRPRHPRIMSPIGFDARFAPVLRSGRAEFAGPNGTVRVLDAEGATSGMAAARARWVEDRRAPHV